MSQEKRIRVNAKQTSKGEWYFDITAETTITSEDGRATNIVNAVSVDCLEAVTKLEEKFRSAGHKLVTDEKKDKK